MSRFIFLILLILSPFSSLLAEMEFYSFIKEPIDVVIPCTKKDLPILNRCIKGIRKNGRNVRRIIVVSKEKLTDKAEWFDEAHYPFSFEEVKTLLNTISPLCNEIGRTGWYYQQILKLYAPLVIPHISSNVLIVDSDLIFLKPVSFLNEKNGGMYNPGTEYNPPYFEHASRLIPKFCKKYPQYSGISHHMLFQRSVIEKIFQEVENLHQAPFWQTFCNLVDPSSACFSGASEYEIYFNYIFSHTDQVSLRMLKWANIQKISDISRYKKKGFDYVCLHSYNRVEG